jgi:hypothetical protein
MPDNRKHDVDLMKGVIVIVAYRPKPGRESETLDNSTLRPCLAIQISLEKSGSNTILPDVYDQTRYYAFVRAASV